MVNLRTPNRSPSLARCSGMHEACRALFGRKELRERGMGITLDWDTNGVRRSSEARTSFSQYSLSDIAALILGII